MAEQTTIRPFDPADWPALDRLYPAAFPEEDLRPLVQDLISYYPPVLGLVACTGDDVCGHVVFTRCTVGGGEGAQVSLLGPLCVLPDLQKSGIGSALVRAGLAQEKAGGSSACLVLGDPGYYGRFGFEADRRIEPPYPLPEDWYAAWQILSLSGDAVPEGQLEVPWPWKSESYWSD